MPTASDDIHRRFLRELRVTAEDAWIFRSQVDHLSAVPRRERGTSAYMYA